jgi:ligand-binding sensor domain-containing protein
MPFLKKIKQLIIFSLIVSVELCFAQTYVSKHYDITNGLPSNSIKCIYKDSRDLLWIGTENGLCLFNGKEFKVFTIDNGLAGNDIWKIVEDKKNNLWISCYADGLSMFDGETFTNYNTSNGLVNNSIRTLYVNNDNQLFIGTQNGMSVLEGNKFKNFNKPPTKEHKTPFQVMQFINKNNEDYVMTYRHGFYKYNEKDSLYLDSITYINSAFKYLEHKTNYFYSTAFGLYSDTIKPNFSNVKSLKTHLSDDIIWDYTQVNDTIYLASWGVNHSAGGVLKFDSNVLKNINSEYNIESAKVWSLYYDKDSNHLWVGTLDNGIYILDLSNAISYESLEDFSLKNEEIIDIEILNDTKWLLCSKGLLRLKGDKTKFFKNEYFKIEASEFLTNNKSVVFNELKIFNHSLYLNTNIGLYKLSESGVIDAFYSTHINGFVFQDDGVLLTSKPYDNFKIYPDINKSLQTIVYDKSDKNTPVDVVDAVYVNKKAFFASYSRGLHAFQDNTFTSLFHNNLLKEKNIQHLLVVNENLLFIASISGNVYVADISADFKIVKKYDKNIIHGNTILFLEHYNNHLFVGTNKGLNIINNDGVQFINEEQGLNDRNFTASKIYNDSLFIGTKNGIYTIKLSNLLNKKSKPIKITIDEIKINYKPLPEGKYNWFSLNENTLSLPYNENTLDISIKTNELYSPNKIMLFYSLNNKEFIPIDNNRLHLTNLSSDTYNISLKIKNELKGTEQVTNLLNFKIGKPYWQTIWFWAIICICIALLVSLKYTSSIKKIKIQEALKSDLNKRIAETKLEALQSQMNPHFTFNAMSSIQNYVIDNDIDLALMYIGEFSKLIRKTLDNSSESYITLKEEIDYLNTYIKLENMRFDNAIDIVIDYTNLDIYSTMIPPMLIQPLVENTFNHAFIETNKKHKLIITFSKENKYLKCVVNDNGVGIGKKANTPNTTSKGLKIIKERLQILHPNSLIELIHINSTNYGTITTILIPIKDTN